MTTTGIFRDGFGDGWLSRNALDLMRVCVALGGYAEDELVRRVIVARPHGVTNTSTVERVLGEMLTEDRIAHDEPTPGEVAAQAIAKMREES